jgi:3-oxoacyl-[acyl-carrier-protein] synthase III
MRDIRVTGIGAYVPRTMHTDETLPALDEPITEAERARIGVRRRGWAADDEGIAEMAVEASRRALDRAEVGAETLDLVILSNWTQRRFIPDFAPRVQHLLGARRAFAFDVCCACAGFVSGLTIAGSFLDEGRAKRALVVAAETTSRRARPGSKATLVFGDGAGAFVLERGPGRGHRLLACEVQSDGSQYGAMCIDDNGWVKTHIPQKELQELAARSFARACAGALARAWVDMRSVDWIVPHSGTAGIQAVLLRTLDVPADRVLTNFADVGNVSSAAIPVALDQFLTEGRIRPGQIVLSPTTGTGWYSAAMLLEIGA